MEITEILKAVLLLYDLSKIIWKGIGYLIGHWENISFWFRNYDKGNYYQNTPFTFNGEQFVSHG